MKLTERIVVPRGYARNMELADPFSTGKRSGILLERRRLVKAAGDLAICRPARYNDRFQSQDKRMNGEPRQIKLTCQVDNYRNGWTIVQFLAHRFKYHTSDAWHERVLDRSVRVNGAVIEPHGVVAKDDQVEYTIWHTEPPVDFRYDVLFEDEWLLAVSKSGNIPVHSCGVYITHTLIARLRNDFGPHLRLAHRLDRETSGVTLLCKDRETARAFGDMFHRGEVGKTYFALVDGMVGEDKFEVDAPIGRIDQRETYAEEYEYARNNDLAFYLPKRRVDFDNGKPSHTRFQVLKRGERFTTLEAVPLTGRTNQIRVHLAHAGHPIIGDKIFYLRGDLREECLRQGLTARVRDALVLDRHALHCRRLDFVHPHTHKRTIVYAPIPPDINVI